MNYRHVVEIKYGGARKMKNNQKLSVMCAGFALLIVGLSCSLTSRAGELLHEAEVIELGGIDSVTANLRMGAGELTISGGTTDSLVDADFTYNVADWKPILDYTVSGGAGELWIEQPEVKNMGLDDYRYAWDLHFNEDVPITNLNIELGAGKSQIDLSQLSLTEFDLRMGVGDVDINFTGARSSDVNAIIQGGAGQMTVLLPEEVGVHVDASGGLGSIKTEGLIKQGESYVNHQFGETESTIMLQIVGGIGEINLRVVE